MTYTATKSDKIEVNKRRIDRLMRALQRDIDDNPTLLVDLITDLMTVRRKLTGEDND